LKLFPWYIRIFVQLPSIYQRFTRAPVLHTLFFTKFWRQKLKAKTLGFETFCEKTFVQKTNANNVDEIDTSRQFDQHFFARFFRTDVVLAAFSSYILALAPKFVQKMRA
jgi:hypothetical protein